MLVGVTNNFFWVGENKGIFNTYMKLEFPQLLSSHTNFSGNPFAHDTAVVGLVGKLDLN